jgi:hypothetical protein
MYIKACREHPTHADKKALRMAWIVIVIAIPLGLASDVLLVQTAFKFIRALSLSLSLSIERVRVLLLQGAGACHHTVTDGCKSRLVADISIPFTLLTSFSCCHFQLHSLH